MDINPLLNVDSYKTSHFLQYPPGAEVVSSYIESRGGEYANSVFFGIQMFLKEYLSRPITQEHIDEADDVLCAHGVPFNRAGWAHILNTHGGFLPLEIEAVPEGTVLPVSNVLVQARNTDPAVPWLTSYIETALLRAVWYPTTIATRSRECRETIRLALEETGDSTAGLEFKLHDFGARGTSSCETAAIGGAAHLLNFLGTDTINGITALRHFYNADMPGFSIPAAEHSTITCWGREREVDAYRNMLDRFAADGKIVAVVSDSYDLFAAIDKLWGGELRERVICNGGTVVIRPDSGKPEEIVCESIRRLMGRFGYQENSKGYRVLPPFVRVIQGDGVSPDQIRRILAVMKTQRLSAENIAFGMGGELLQNVNRDTMQFAMKASAIRINDEWSDVYKEPVTDSGKRSKRGRLALVTDGLHISTIRKSQVGDLQDLLRPIFCDGELLIDEDFATVRGRLTDCNL
ncbi:MAG: nicotinate phosphoribosyltransferase [Candidatus Latescibacteria bacterium]|nr:nicotinate phosphoribosyltransferase [Candidatus Latescibacterota bacterium]